MTLLASLDPTTPSAENLAVSNDQYHLMHDVLDALPEREANIVSMRLSLCDDPDTPHTWTGIGQTYGISASRARQIYYTAIKRMHVAAYRPHGPLNRAVISFAAA